jgi:hypothetical protein
MITEQKGLMVKHQSLFVILYYAGINVYTYSIFFEYN